MIEPEMAFVEFEENLEVQEQYVAHIVQSVLANCKLDLERLGVILQHLKTLKRHSLEFLTMMRLSFYTNKASTILSGAMILVRHMKQRLRIHLTNQYLLLVTQ